MTNGYAGWGVRILPAPMKDADQSDFYHSFPFLNQTITEYTMFFLPALATLTYEAIASAILTGAATGTAAAFRDRNR